VGLPPLNNPQKLQFNAFLDNNPKGFGLLQLDRDFSHYQDVMGWYNKRPSLWVEPRNQWGKGSVGLMEIPTTGETLDNVVCFWQPEKPVRAGDELAFSIVCTGAPCRRYVRRWRVSMPPAPVWAASRKGGRRANITRKNGRVVSPLILSVVT
jgi:hypothetical protein